MTLPQIRRWIAAPGVVAITLLIIFVVAGCTNTIRTTSVGPQTASDRVFVVDHGYHTRLALADRHGGVTEYAFGEWGWYALNQDSPWRIPVVLLWPTPGGYARRVHPSPGGLERFKADNAGSSMLVAPVDPAKAFAFRIRMDAIFASAAVRVYNPRYGLEFVPAGRDYTAFSNSNHVVAEWLEELGFEIDGSRLFANWRLATVPPLEHDTASVP